MFDLGPIVPHAQRILEIGAGRVDSPEIDREWKPIVSRLTLGPDQLYMGIDVGARSLDEPDSYEEADTLMRRKWDSMAQARPNENIKFAQAGGTKLPFADNTFDRVIASNVLGGGTGNETLRDILLESSRVLQDGGEIVLHDDHTPRFQNHNWLNALGLTATRVVRKFPHKAVYQPYGLEFYDVPTSSDPIREQILEDKYRNSTLWVLGKLAIVEANPTESQSQNTVLRGRIRNFRLFNRNK